MILIDLTGKRFGRLTVLSRAKAPTPNSGAYWRCKCDCGKIRIVRGYCLRHRETVSCGCHAADMTRKRSIRHGATVNGTLTPEYYSWMGMKNRCRNPNSPDFEWYGGRGIKVCRRWLKFENFLADMGPRPKGKTLDRYPDRSGDYKKSNCRWATAKQQTANRR